MSETKIGNDSRQPRERPKVHPGGLVTIAFLKAKLDEGSDHLGIFMPLVLDVISKFKESSFVTSDVQNALASTYKLAMPAQTVETLLKRATRQRKLRRESGRYFGENLLGLPNVADETKRIREAQERLAYELAAHAKQRGLMLEPDAALDILFRFLEAHHIALLLDTPAAEGDAHSTPLESAIVAEFVEWVVKEDTVLRAVLNAILEGLVLYHAAFLPDLAEGTRRFKGLSVYFDSDLVRRALGYEGSAMQTLMRQTVQLLKGEGARCLVFDKTVEEVQRILQFYESRFATERGRETLRPSAMTRHFLVSRYSVSDIREMRALLSQNVTTEGFRIMRMPRRIPEYVALEGALQSRLANPITKDESAPRVMHDVDCAAGVLTLRRGNTSAILEECRCVFASASASVIRIMRIWYEQDERGVGIGPMVHIRALANLAFLKSPKLNATFKEQELVALCAASMRPRPETWQRFLKHLKGLEQSNKITSDETALVLVSRMSDQLLREAENEESGDVDAATLDDVVERVRASYKKEYQTKLSAEARRTLEERARADEVERAAEERERRRELVIAHRAQAFAKLAAGVGWWVLAPAILVGAFALILESILHLKASLLVVFAVIIFIVLEALANLKQVSEWRGSTITMLAGKAAVWLRADSVAKEVENSAKESNSAQVSSS